MMLEEISLNFVYLVKIDPTVLQSLCQTVFKIQANAISISISNFCLPLKVNHSVNLDILYRAVKHITGLLLILYLL